MKRKPNLIITTGSNKPVSVVTEIETQAKQGRSPILILSGCYWGAEGAAQRPVALARELAKQGELVVYYNTDDRQPSQRVSGVYCVGPQLWPAAVSMLMQHPGVAIATFPTYTPTMFQLRCAGWRMAYDLLDDWTGFYDAGDLQWSRDQFMTWQRSLTAGSDFVTCSATGLLEQAQGMGCLNPVLIRNGGPEAPFQREQREANGKIRVVYSGCLVGSWLDWSIMEALSKCDDFEVIVVGNTDFGNRPSPLGRCRGIRFVGLQPYEEAMRYMAAADVSIIPFKGNLCQYVDAIKLYDAYAAGVVTVATPVMTEMAGRPFVKIAKPEDFPKAIRQAAALKRRPGPKLVRQEAWSARATQLRELVVQSRQRQVSAAVPIPTPRIVTEPHRLRITWSGPSSCNASPPCAYCCTIGDRAMRPGKLPAPAAEVRDALLRFTEQEGPCLLSVCWGEPLVDDELAGIIGPLGNTNRVDLVSNIRFPIERLRHLTNPANFALCTSFHPQLWNWQTKDFITKRKAIEAEGFHCGVCEVVAYPDWFDKLPQWFEELRAAGVDTSVLPYQGRHKHTGKVYPSSYDEAQWEFLKSNLIVYHQDLRDGVYDGTVPPTGKLCSVGRDYVFIDWSGEVLRCVIPQHTGPYSLGSIFSGWKLLEEPAPCSGTACPCADLWQFIEEQGK